MRLRAVTLRASLKNAHRNELELEKGKCVYKCVAFKKDICFYLKMCAFLHFRCKRNDLGRPYSKVFHVSIGLRTS